MHFAANVSMLWPDVADPYRRFDLAAEAGFRRVERLFIHDLEVTRLGATLSERDLKLVLFDAHPGDWERGERGLLFLPGREAEFAESVAAAVTGAAQLGVPFVNVLAGRVAPDVDPRGAYETALRNLDRAVPMAKASGVSLLIEAINPVDAPGYAVSTIETACALVRDYGDPAVGIQFDTYHVAKGGGDVITELRAASELVRHVQIADFPGRHEPGSGKLPLEGFLDELSTMSYAGAIGLEYVPRTTTAESLRWLPRSRRS